MKHIPHIHVSAELDGNVRVCLFAAQIGSIVVADWPLTAPCELDKHFFKRCEEDQHVLELFFKAAELYDGEFPAGVHLVVDEIMEKMI